MRKMTTILVFALGVTSGLGVANAAFMPHGDNRAYFLGQASLSVLPSQWCASLSLMRLSSVTIAAAKACSVRLFALCSER